jgi:hypothetical protein
VAALAALRRCQAVADSARRHHDGRRKSGHAGLTGSKQRRGDEEGRRRRRGCQRRCTKVESSEVAGNQNTRRQKGGEHGGQSREKTAAWCAHPGRGGEARPSGDGGVAHLDMHGRKRKGGGGFAPAVGMRTWAAGSTLSGVARAPGRRRLYGTARVRGSAAAARAPGGDGVPMSGPSAERGRLTGETPRQIIPKLKTILNENSSKEMARS